MAGCGCGSKCGTYSKASSLEMAAQRIKHHFSSVKAAKRAIATKKKNPSRVIPKDFTKDGYVKKSVGGRGKKY
tara:strand:- start:112 stop:330 length:219 start_codon:yes stop_codon:yes gene_type:complete